MKKNGNPSTEIEKIVSYWNTNLLCSRESSTSHACPDLAYLDNAIENRLLQRILTDRHARNIAQRRCLDVGAGYGRFVPTFHQFYADIVLLEAADSIYSKLFSLWGHMANVSFALSTFERLEDEREFDLIFASGVLYLYDDGMLQRFIEKCRNLLAKTGLLILRDFVATPPRVTKSAYVENVSCHYRSLQFWHDCASPWGFEPLRVYRSKPHLTFLRRSRVLSALRRLRLSRSLRYPMSVATAERFGNWKISGNEIHTVYLVMRVP